MSIGGQWMNLLTDAINTFLKNVWFKGIMRNCAPMWNVEQTVKIPYGQRTVEFAVQIFGKEPVRMVSQTPQIPVLSIRRWSLLEALTRCSRYQVSRHPTSLPCRTLTSDYFIRRTKFVLLVQKWNMQMRPNYELAAHPIGTQWIFLAN